MKTEEFRNMALDESTWFIHWELWQAAHEMGLERRQTTLGYSLDLTTREGDEITVFQGLVDGLRLPLRYMWPYGSVTDQYRRGVAALMALTDAEKEPSGKFPDDFDQRDAKALVKVLRRVVDRIGKTQAVASVAT